MQIDDKPAGSHRITAYGEGYFAVDDTRFEGSLIVTPERVIECWAPASAQEIDAGAMAVLAELGCEVVLLGTGAEQRFPEPAVLAGLMGRGIGVEVMSSDAACRTYNILMAEGRRVAAALVALRAPVR